MESEVKQRNTWRLRDLRREIDASNWALARVHLPPSHFQARWLSQLVSQYGSFSFPFSFAFEYLFLPTERTNVSPIRRGERENEWGKHFSPSSKFIFISSGSISCLLRLCCSCYARAPRTHAPYRLVLSFVKCYAEQTER